MKPPVILIDTMNLAFRCHYAYRNLTCEHVPTGVVYGVPKIINDLRKSVSPRMIFCWDHGVPVPGAVRPHNWRERYMPSYKATRKRDTEDRDIVTAQLADLHKELTWLGYGSASVMGLEADDIIGLLCTQHAARGEVLIFSTDRDFYQLLAPNVRVLVPKKQRNGFQQITADDVETEFGVGVDRWAEFLALGGDSADNIKPRKGMGPKTAAKLIRAGVTLRNRAPFAQQPATFKEKYADLEPIWDQILLAYYAARIPRSAADRRIKDYADEFNRACVNIPAEQSWKDEAARRRAEDSFARFCADREMATILAIRRQLFGEPLRQCTPRPPVPQRKHLQKSILDL